MSSEKKNNDYLLEVEHLKQYFPVHQGFSTTPLKAVDDISFAIRPGETLGRRVRLWKDNSRPYTASPVSADGR